MLSQSSVTKCRSLVMLGCLVTVPLIAMFGPSLPELMDRFAEFQPTAQFAEAARPAVIADSPPEAGPRVTATARLPLPDPWSDGDLSRQGLTPASYQTWAQPEGDGGAQAVQDPRVPAIADDRLATVQRHLQQLGATYYRLESWGDDGPRFRFACRVAFEGNPTCAKHFEATDRDAAQAVAKVVRQVETWVAVRRTPSGG